jgi:hypothetical protein
MSELKDGTFPSKGFYYSKGVDVGKGKNHLFFYLDDKVDIGKEGSVRYQKFEDTLLDLSEKAGTLVTIMDYEKMLTIMPTYAKKIQFIKKYLKEKKKGTGDYEKAERDLVVFTPYKGGPIPKIKK